MDKLLQRVFQIFQGLHKKRLLKFPEGFSEVGKKTKFSHDFPLVYPIKKKDKFWEEINFFLNFPGGQHSFHIRYELWKSLTTPPVSLKKLETHWWFSSIFPHHCKSHKKFRGLFFLKKRFYFSCWLHHMIHGHF